MKIRVTYWHLIKLDGHYETKPYADCFLNKQVERIKDIE